MSDSALVPVRRRPAKPPQHERITKALSRKGFSRRADQLTDLMVFEQLDVKAAAQQAGFSLSTARALLRNPKIIQQMRAKVEVLRTSEGALNIHVARVIRDRAMAADASAAQQNVSLKAIAMLEGSQEGGTTNNFNGPTLIAGYVVKLDGPAEGPRVIGNSGTDHAKPLIEHEE